MRIVAVRPAVELIVRGVIALVFSEIAVVLSVTHTAVRIIRVRPTIQIVVLSIRALDDGVRLVGIRTVFAAGILRVGEGVLAVLVVHPVIALGASTEAIRLVVLGGISTGRIVQVDPAIPVVVQPVRALRVVVLVAVKALSQPGSSA